LTDYLTEQEQVELLKNWIKQYSIVIILGIAIASAGIFGWRYYQQRQSKTFDHASLIYDQMLTMRSQNDPDKTLAQAKRLANRYPQTSYGQFAALMVARDAISKNDVATAESELRSVIKHTDIPSLRQVARLRLARLLLAKNTPEAALKELTKIDDATFDGLIQEIQGDAYLALKDTAKARLAYGEALSALPNADVVRPLLRMKYDNLATTVDPT
jgi:predicted negative regulator of RcsB-dependent stress response